MDWSLFFPRIGNTDASVSLPEIGKPFPSFRLPGTQGRFIENADLGGTRTLLFSYPLNFSPVCSNQVILFNEILPEFERLGVQLCGLSVDSPFCHHAFRKQYGLRFHLLADFEPKGGFARELGVYLSGQGVAGRALFLIDEQGLLQYREIAPFDQVPGVDTILSFLEEELAA